MNKTFKLQCEHYLANPELLKMESGEKEKLLAKLKRFVNGEEPSAADLHELAMAADVNFKALADRYCLMDYAVISENMIRRLIDCEDVKTLLYIADNHIIKYNRRFFCVTGSTLYDDAEISMETMEKLRNLFLKHGYSDHAGRISSSLSFYQPESLESLICSEETLKTYMFGKIYRKAPVCDRLTVMVFNGLDESSKEKLLEVLVQAYRNFKDVEKEDQRFISAVIDEKGTRTWISKADFNLLETESSLKNELIELQNRYYGI